MSNKTNTARDFIAEAFKKTEKAMESRIGAPNLRIWAGQFSALGKDGKVDQLSKFLNAWAGEDGPTFKWAMVEEVSQFRVKRADLPELVQRQDQIERLRLFGDGGDLDVRRDADVIYWRFISETVNQLPSLPDFETASFWDDEGNQGRTFARHERDYFQWRREKKEQRVTHDWAPDDGALKKMNYLRQVHYLENGRIAFVRYVDFAEDKS